jgi:hypothetical protein
MEPIEVTAHFDEEGKITPLHFTWKGSRLKVESTGRRWTDENGQHLLVMASSGRIYQLTFRGMEGRWYIERTQPENPVV